MPKSVRVGKKSQIVIPREIRDGIGIAEGDELIIDVIGDRIIIMLKPESYSKKLKGLHKDIWKDIDPKEHVRKERETW
ncbi:MAG: AbrB family transcriptional regulator [Candidatus Schekmanbacteria bacterium RBG_13_48_7]|uniref:AbrB family transcriptional regulator n=1 Tax=Candidatus Schekmanbacteria bacterium RBG_13_48_7 TaxID=1817878 RepID=A0A1F7RRJ1_9BACT|nr:MAG: AbrB family transcriptional regulator [Candidatus Schekmanbacteria bacterium RBG_13_48_7]